MREIMFSPERALESLLYLANKLGNPTIHELLKLRYFADKLHLSKYGWMASGDDYVAMRFGPVATNTYDLIKAARGDESPWIHPRFIELAQGVIELRDNKYVKPLREPRVEMLSAADIECLDEAISQYGNMRFEERTNLSHDDAWKKAWDSATEEDLKAGSMPVADIAQTLPNADEILEYINA
jgi:uncharacterized phage-associated protein